MMTGNLIMSVSAFIIDGWQVKEQTHMLPDFIFHFAIIVMFSLGNVAYTICVEKCTDSAKVLAPLLFMVFASHEFIEHYGLGMMPHRWQVLGVSFAFGATDAFVIVSDCKRIPNLVTTTTANLSASIANALLHGLKALPDEDRGRDMAGLFNILSFVIGALVGLLLVEARGIDNHLVMLPVAAILSATLLVHGRTLPRRRLALLDPTANGQTESGRSDIENATEIQLAELGGPAKAVALEFSDASSPARAVILDISDREALP